MGFFDRLKSGLKKTKEGFSDRVNTLFSAFTKIDEELFEELEELLIMADVGFETTERILDGLRANVKKKGITDPNLVKHELSDVICDILDENDNSMRIDTKPSVIVVVGVNGVGKTTTIGKMATYYTGIGKKVLLAAGDTFRAAAAEQLDIWAKRAECEIIKHNEGADPGAVIFDAVSAAKNRGADLVICDTAGRLHTKKNLMEELAKIIRIIDRELPGADKEILLVLDATTGQNAVQQAKLFDQSTGLTGLVLTKLDGTAKGGVVISLCNSQKIPVKFIGVGEQKDDLQPFVSQDFVAALFE
ncbi:MAG: signal recognition particle-docking protein FtsY [Clostridia bacterium]|nr:signal recognition particle-docking protein FtsY [Clostridia bacterium]